jgi:hypothetical protein
MMGDFNLVTALAVLINPPVSRRYRYDGACRRSEGFSLLSKDERTMNHLIESRDMSAI